MQQNEFKIQIEKLANNFGARYFSQEKVNLLWLRFKYLFADQFTEVVDFLILNQNTPPKLDDFEAAIRRKKTGAVRRTQFCNQCKNGFILNSEFFEVGPPPPVYLCECHPMHGKLFIESEAS